MEPDPPERLVSTVARLWEDWGDIPLEEAEQTLDPEEYEYHRDACDSDGTFVYAGALVTRDGELLLVKPEWADGWTEPGGAHESGETVEETARREVREETGLDVALDGLHRVNLLEQSDGERPPLYTLGATFRATPTGGDLRPEPGEIDDVGWFETLPEDLAYENWGESVPEEFR